MSKSVLVVDDEKEVRLMMQSVLMNKGYFIDEAQNSRDALQKLLYKHFDLVIFDLETSKIEGFSFMEKMKEMNISIPVIVMTARHEILSISGVFRRGKTLRLTKPFNKNELADVVSYLIEDVSEEERRRIEENHLL